MTVNAGAHRAGRLILAVADRDDAQISAIIHEASDASPTGGLELIVQLASASIESMRLATGEHWRDVLTTALHAIELDGAT